VSGPGAPYTYKWTADAAAGGTSAAPNQLTASFSPVTGATAYTLTVTNSCGNPFSGKATVTIVATPRQAIQAIAPKTVASGKCLTCCASVRYTPFAQLKSLVVRVAQRGAYNH
jgi:hypothetical protein